MPESLPQEPTELDEDEEESDVESPPGSPQPYHITASRQSIGRPRSGAQVIELMLIVLVLKTMIQV